MIDTGLQRLFANLEKFDYNETNLLSCMTLDVENCQSTIHVKQLNMSKTEYCSSFGLTVKETVKGLTNWGAYYHTRRNFWYPKPEGSLFLSQVPVMKILPIVHVCPTDCDALRDWSSLPWAAVKQRMVRQETTMTHGTLPEFMYERQSKISDVPVSIIFDKKDNTADAATRNDLEEDKTELFDQNSDEEVVDDCREETLFTSCRDWKLSDISSGSKNLLREIYVL